MQLVNMSAIRRFGKRAFRVMVCLIMVLQTLWIPNSALAASAFYFRGFGSENVSGNTFAYATSGATVSGTTVTASAGSPEGMAVGLINLNEDGHDISQSVDLGGLEIDFSALTTVTQEGTDGSENDVPTVDINFCSTNDIGSSISSVHLAKPDNAVSGGVTLSSGAHIPSGTRSIFITVTGTNTNGDNTVVFSDISLVIRDAGAPSCSVDYNKNWTNQDVTVTVTASDADAGLEGIYRDGSLVSTTSPYSFVVSSNNTSFSIYAKDLAGKQSDSISETIDKIDKTVPSAPTSVPLSSSDWSNTDVTVNMPALGTSSGAPERYVYQTGTSAWADLTDGYAISANGYTTIRVAVEDAAGNRSSYVEATAKIDKLAPTIGTPTLTVGSGSTRVDITATEQGLSGLKRFAYAAGTQTADYFAANGTDIVSNNFTVTSGGNYTVFASDNAGNTVLQPLSLTTAPTLAAISDVAFNEDNTCEVYLTVSDAESTLSELGVKVTTTNDALLGTVTVNKADTGISLSITPAANQSGGPVTVTVEVSDPGGLKVTRSFNVTVNAVNDPPVAQDDSGIVLDEDTTATIDVLANDSDLADGDTLSIASVGNPAHGTALIVLGKVRYTPDANYSGTDSFDYTVSDGKGGTDDATVSVTVTNVNDAPVARPDTTTAREDMPATINVLSNDYDVDTAVDTEENFALFSCADGAHGTTEISEGMIVYTPAANFNGTDTFTYIIMDNGGLTSETTVTVVVSPESDDPIFNALSNEYTIDEDSKNAEIAFEISDVETPLNSVMLQAASLNTDVLEQSGISITGLGDNSAAVKLLLSPVADMYGDVQIQLTLGDGFNTVERTITVHVQNVNDAPRAGADTVNYTEGAVYVDISIPDLLANDSDIEHDTITYDGLATLSTVGTIEELDSTTLRYTPVPNYDGTDSFTYYISDGTARTLATCTLKATSVNDAPTIVVDEASYRTNEDTKIVIPFKISDQESDAASLSVVAATSNDDIATTDGIVIVNNGDGTGEVQITPAADANGTVTITLTVSDGEAQSSDDFALVIDPVQDAPIAVNDKVYVLYSGSRTFSVLENDHDVDGETLTVKSYVEDLPGTLTFNEETQQFVYYPAIGENGISTFTYTVTDGKDTATGTVTLNVSTVTHAPTITSIDSKYVSEDGTVSGIAFSVSDEDYGDTASITVAPVNTTLLPKDDSHIQVTNLGEGNYVLALTPGADQFGTTAVTVTVTDSTMLTDSTTFNLIVMGQNDPPLAVNDEFTINEDSSLPLTLLANDSDPDGDTIWLSSISSASHGYIESYGRNYTYYPYGDWHGTDTITYRVSDGRTTSQATATITVNPVNDRPVAWDDWRELPNNVANESAKINVLGNDYDVDTGDVIHTYEIVTAPRHGTAVINADGTITYTRSETSPEGNGADSFVYRIIDREAATGEYSYDDATVYIGIEFRSSLYTYGRSITCNEDDAAFNVGLSISNPNGVDYTLTINTPTTLGTFEVLDNNTVRFTPAPNQNGYANITYTVEQVGGTEKDTGVIWLRVYPVNDPPKIDSAPASVTMNEDTPGGSTFDVTFHDPDCAFDDLYFYVYTQNGATTGPIPFQTNYSVSRDDGTATITVTTPANSNGTGKIVVGVSDGINYDEKVIDLTVTPVDDAPVVNSVTRTIYEDSKVTFASPGSDSEADGDTTKESILPADAPQHGKATINSNQTILYVPDANFYGTDTFYVTITDQTTAALSSRAKVTIYVNPVNDQPEIFDLDYYQSTPEDTEKDVTLTVIDVDNDLSGASSYTITSSDQALVKDENISIVNVSGNQMKIHLIPEANANGKIVVSIVASDGSLTAEGAFELKIVPVNDVPIAKNDTGNMDEAVSTGAETTPPKTTTTLNLLTNDSDVEDGKPKIVSITNVVNGTVTNLGNGSVSVSADGDSTADVTFTYTVMDRAGATASATVLVTINPKNDPPRAKDDSLTINEDAQPSISVLSNDTDPEGDTLSISTVTDPKHGTATINGTKVDYVPTKDYYGSDYFTYTVSDGNGGTSTATVRITLKPVNDAPTIEQIVSGEGGWTMEEDTPTSFDFTVADAETAMNGLIIKITSLDPNIIKTEQIALSTSESGNKTITITPEKDAHGDARIQFVVSDGLLSTQKVYIVTVISINDAPVVTAEKQKTKEDNAITATATATDADGDSVTFAKSTDPGHGTVVVSLDGTYTYTPSKDFNGEDSFVIAADDGHASNHVGFATVYITVTPDGDPPTAGDDSITIDEDTPSVIPVLTNDSDPDAAYGDKISIYHISTPAHGTAVVDDGGILYTPAADYNGTDSFTYTITDLDGKMDTASVSITINPVNDTPRGGDDTATVLEDHSVTIDAAANDDVDETTNPTLEDVTITQVDVPAHGTAVIDAGLKTITYTPDANWFSPADEPEVFSYTATDSSGKSARFSITVTVTSVNDLPVITPDKLTDVETNEDTETSAITFTVSDIETAAGALSVSVTQNNSTLLPNVTVTPNASGVCSFTVTPKANKVGTATFTVTVTDADGGKDSDTFKLTVKAVNDLPTATDDAFDVAENSSRVYNVLANDDVDILPNNGGDTLTLLSVATPQYGTATIENNQLKYVPDSTRTNTANYTDVFTYTMKDASNNEDTATVTVTVTPVNDPPTMTAIADVTGILEDAPDGTGPISFSVTDEEDDDDTLQILIESSNPSLFPVGNITVVNPTDDATGALRTVKVVPAANQFGTGNIKLTVRDSLGLTYSRTFSVTVESVNDVPTNGNESFEVTEDVEKQLDVLTGIDVDYATDPNDITVKSIATPPTHGTAYVAADGRSIYYKTAQDSNLPDSFEYTIHDAYGNADYTFTATITVIPVNDAPVITYTGPSSYETYQGTPKNDIPFTVTDVDNVTDASGTAPVEVTLSAKSSNTLLLRNGINIDTMAGNNRNIDLQPYLKWNGTTTVTITAKDPGGLTATASFQLIVNNVNDSPVAVNDTGIVQEDKTTAVYVLVNDLDDDLLTNPDTEFIKIKSVVDNDSNATIVPASDGLSVLVTPNANYNGPVSFSYTIEDSMHAESNSATVSLTVAQVNDAPVAGNDTKTTAEDTAVVIPVLGNDSDVDMDTTLNAHPELESIGVVITGASLVKAAHGSISTDGTTITYTPNADYNGSDTFEYYCSDGEELTKASVTVTITQVNDAPVANPDTARISEDSATDYIDVMANDTDVDTGAALNQNDQYLTSKFSVSAAWIDNPAIGSVDLTGNKIKFTPATNWNGTAVVHYTLLDGYGASCDSTLTVTVDPVNDLPVFSTAPENLTLSEDGANGTTDIVVGDVETASSSLAVTVTNSSNPSLIATTDVTVTKGTNGNRTITVNPKDNQNGTATITLQVDDLTLGKTTITFLVTVDAVNDNPVSDDKTLNIAEDASKQTITKASVAHDVDIATNADVLTLTITTAASHGTAAIDASGNITYIPLANFNGTDTFVYTATDKAGAKDTGTVTVNVSPSNDAPVAGNDTKTTAEDTAVVIPVLGNDSDVDMDTTLNAHPELESIGVVITGASLVKAAHGSISTDGTTITYTPNADYNGSDTFEYYCSDGDTQTKASVTVTITQVNDAPVANPDTARISEDSATDYIDVMANDTDVDTGAALNQNDQYLTSKFSVSAAWIDNPAIGTVDLTGNKIKFTPATNWNGTAVVHYTLLDGYGASCDSTLTVTVDPVNDLPVFSTAPENLTLSEDGANGTTDIVVGDVETASSSLAVTVTNSSNPSLIATTDVTVTKGNNGNRTITVNPKDNQNGTATITLQVDDLTLGKTTITFLVTVNAVNDDPVADDKTLNIAEDASKQTITKASVAHDVDIATNADALTLTITTAASHGTAAIDASGNITYIPLANFNGTDTFVYTATDKAGAKDTGTVTVNVSPSNDAPVAGNDTKTTAEDTAVVIPVLGNDSDIDMDTTLNAHPELESIGVVITGASLVKAAHGSISTDGTTITYTPNADYNGSDTFEYYCSDGEELTKASVTVTITQVNDAPVANPDTARISEDSATDYIDVMANDTDVDTGATLNQNDQYLTSKFSVSAAWIDNPAIGTVDLTGNKIKFTPATNWNGTAVVHYTLLDGYGASCDSTLTVTVDPVNDLPVFSTPPENLTISEDGANGTTDIVVGDVETEAKSLDVTVLESSNPSLIATTDVTVTKGTNGNRTITVNPKDNQNGEATITLQVDDLTLGLRTITFVVTVNAVNDDPVADDKTLNIAEDASTQTITKASVTQDVDIATNEDALTLTITTAASHGTAAIDASGNITYIPLANFNGTDTFVYTATDKAGAKDTGTVTVNVSPSNDAPVAGNDTKTTAEDTAVVIPVLDNDSDVDMDTTLNAHPELESIGVVITGASLVKAAHGSISTDGTTITYTPNADYNGSDTFEYYCSDGEELTKASVTVTITQVDDSPVANPDTARISEDSATDYIDVMANDTDVDLDSALNENELYLRDKFYVSAASVIDSSVGTVDLKDNKIKFTPAANWTGEVTVYYTLQDGYGMSCSTGLRVTVDPVNDLPVFSTAPENLTISEDGANGTTDIVVSDVETEAKSLDVTVLESSNPGLIATTDVTVTAGTNGNRTITVNPKDNQNGTATITLQVDDLTLGKTTITFLVTVDAVNDNPVSDDKTLNIAEDASKQTITKASVTHDVDIATNEDALTLTITTAASHGTAAIDADGNITYIPLANFNGTDTFVYTATDKAGAKDTGTVTVNVSPSNDAPVAGNDTKTTAEDTAVVIPVLGNDSDVDMDTTLNAHPELESIGVVITGASLVKAAHGSISTDGTTITYTPNADYNGSDTFEYYCSDGEELTKASVTVTITQVDDSPVANPDTARISEDSATDYIDVMANDTDVDLDSALNENELHLRDKFYVSAASVIDSSVGTVDLKDNKIKFTPAANWTGEVTVYYTLQDGYGMSCSTGLRVTVDPINDLPVFSTPPENLTISEDGANGTTDIVVGDVETEAKSLDVTVLESSNPGLIATTDVTVTNGTNGNRTITVNPKDNQNGTATITLQVDDLTLGKTTITFLVTVNAVNDDPVADDKTLNIAEDASTQTITKASVAHDVDIATNADVLTLTITTAASHGTAAIDASGNITYIPLANFNGTDTFVYTATDKAGAKDTGTVTVNVSPSNDAPVAGNDTKTTAEDMAVVIPVLDNDSDVDMDTTLNAHPELESIGVVITGDALVKPAHGKITTDGEMITYTPNADYNGSDTFEYYCSDGEELTKASVTVTITQVNDNPIAVADSGSTKEDVPVSVNVLDNDTDVDTINALNENELHLLSDLSIVSCSIYGTAHGTVTKNGASIDYDPEADFHGTQTIHYVLSDGHDGTSIGTLIIEVGSENDAPVAVNDEMSADEDHVASVNVLSNDTDVDTEDTKTFVGFTESTSGLPGTFTTNAKGDITFTPDANYNGSFTIRYQMKDAAGLTSIAKLTVTINPINDTPTASDANVTTNEDHAKGTDVSGLIGDVDILTNADELTVTVASEGEPQHGTVSVSGTTITYTPDANYNGSDEIEYTVTDKAGAHASAKLSITVNPVNDAPVAQNDTKTAQEDKAVIISALANDSDVDTDTLLNKTPASAPFIESVTNGTHGKATTDGETITYTPDQDFNGTDEISYVLSDGSLTVEAKIDITITQVNDQIQAADDKAQTNDEDTVTIDVLKNDTDVDTDTALNNDVLHLVSDFTLTAVGTPEHGTAKIVSGKISYTPEDRFAGIDHFTYTVSDGHGSSQTAWINVTVLSVNDPPVIIVVSKPQTGDRAGTGSKVTVEWTGFDIDGDALTYKLDYFDGTSWHPVADNLAGTSYIFSIPASLASTDGLKFRVNVRDSEFTSDYGYSGIMSVDRDAPTGSVVTMHTADGRAYTAGTWTNQTVTVVAASAVDASKVTYYYAMDDGTSAAAASMDVVAGVHTVNILATDEFGNTANLGGYLARVDKQQPAEPDISENISGGAVVLSFTFHADPGGSGNNKITLPDGTVVSAADQPTFTVTKNGTYNFALTDVAGNRRTFTYTVGKVDTSSPVIALNSGAYSVGTKTQDAITATLTFTDAQSEITARGYQISTSSTANGTYRAYSSALTLTNPGTYYIHAMAKNAFGLTTYQTYGPFIIEAAAVATATPGLPAASQTPVPTSGDVVVTKEDVEGVPGDAVSIRLPGGEWSDSLTLENVEPGTYLVEVKDKDGNIRTVEVRVTKRDIVARSVRSAKDNITPAAIASIAGGAGILLLLLLAIGHNVTVTVTGVLGGAEKNLRTLRRIKGRKKELIVKLDGNHVKGGRNIVVKLAKGLSKKMRGNTVVVTVRGVEVLREMIPENIDEAFIRTIQIDP